jgi:LuxR family maltose regulon positive regulatory protein
MYLSPHTIRTQGKSVYRKLGAASRSEAVARARELGLLEG